MMSVIAKKEETTTNYLTGGNINGEGIGGKVIIFNGQGIVVRGEGNGKAHSDGRRDGRNSFEGREEFGGKRGVREDGKDVTVIFGAEDSPGEDVGEEGGGGEVDDFVAFVQTDKGEETRTKGGRGFRRKGWGRGGKRGRWR